MSVFQSTVIIMITGLFYLDFSDATVCPTYQKYTFIQNRNTLVVVEVYLGFNLDELDIFGSVFLNELIDPDTQKIALRH